MKIILFCLSFLLLIYPSLTQGFPRTNYVFGKYPSLYEFFNRQPHNIRIASLAQEANNIPAFSQRSILVGSEYFLPYHQNYYHELKQRSQALILAQYSPNLADVQDFIQQYSVDYWLLESDALTLGYVEKNHRIAQLNPEAADIVQTNLRSGSIPILTTVMNRCTVLKVETFTVLETNCILKTR